MASEHDDLHVQAACAKCDFIFDLVYGPDCPRCRHVGVAWARRISTEEYRQMSQSLDECEMRRRAYPGSLLTEGERLDIEELDKLYALEDRRQQCRPYISPDATC
jgi:hypothetical protein